MTHMSYTRQFVCSLPLVACEQDMPPMISSSLLAWAGRLPHPKSLKLFEAAQQTIKTSFSNILLNDIVLCQLEGTIGQVASTSKAARHVTAGALVVAWVTADAVKASACVIAGTVAAMAALLASSSLMVHPCAMVLI